MLRKPGVLFFLLESAPSRPSGRGLTAERRLAIFRLLAAWNLVVRVCSLNLMDTILQIGRAVPALGFAVGYSH